MMFFYVKGIFAKNLNSYSLVLSYFYLGGWSVFFVDGFSQMYSENRFRIEASENVDTHTVYDNADLECFHCCRILFP